MNPDPNDLSRRTYRDQILCLGQIHVEVVRASDFHHVEKYLVGRADERSCCDMVDL